MAPIFRRAAAGGSEPVRLAGEAFGVTFDFVIGDADLAAETRRWLPPDWRDAEPADTALMLRLDRDADGRHWLERDGRVVSSGPSETVFDDFERIVRMHLATTAPDHFFLHAGAVGVGNAGIVIPGASFSGKTSLVAALVRAGATYYSDELAVIDADGRLHPYPKPLGLRLTDGRSAQTNRHASDLGAASGAEPAPVSLVVAAEFRPRAAWEPAVLSQAETVLILMQHTFRGLDRPQETMRAMLAAAEGAVGLKGDRGEADAVAEDLLERVGAGS